MSDDKKLTTRAEDFSAWYNEVVLRAELADYSPVRGCMVIRPAGYGIWERMQHTLDEMFKATGHQKRLLPAPNSGELSAQGGRARSGLRPGDGRGDARRGKGARRAVGHPADVGNHHHSMFASGCRAIATCLSHQPVGDVVRWEMRTVSSAHARIPLARGHTAHVTHDEAEEEGRKILGLYSDSWKVWMACP